MRHSFFNFLNFLNFFDFFEKETKLKTFFSFLEIQFFKQETFLNFKHVVKSIDTKKKRKIFFFKISNFLKIFIFSEN